MPEARRRTRGLLDTSVVIDLERIYAAVAARGRKARGRRAVDLLIAATALAAGLFLYTRNPEDLDGLGDLLDVRPLDVVE